MVRHTHIIARAFTVVFAGLWLSGCLPTVDPAKTPAPAAPAPAVPTSEPAPAPEKVEPLKPVQLSSSAAPDGSAPKTTMKFQVMPRAGESEGDSVIRVEKAPEGHYKVSGGKGLQGTIKADPAGGWLFEATLSFPFKGYKPGEPFAGVVGNMPRDEEPMTTISVPFSYPPKGTAKVEEVESFPVKLKFDAPANTQFVVFLMPTL